MTRSKLRRQIAWHAARMMYHHQESDYYPAKLKAVQLLGLRWVKSKDLPSNVEIRDEILQLARVLEGNPTAERLRAMRQQAARTMRLLHPFRPNLVGDVWEGNVHDQSQIELQVFSDFPDRVTQLLKANGIAYHFERLATQVGPVEKPFFQILFSDGFPCRLTVLPSDLGQSSRISSNDGPAVGLEELERLINDEDQNGQGENNPESFDEPFDRFHVYRTLLTPLESVIQDRNRHPEGDALYHSLQVFDLAVDQRPYDEEFVTAALLHDVGKGIDPFDHVNAGLAALSGYITDRTAWLIEHHSDTHRIVNQTIGARAYRRLRENENFEELRLLGECDLKGRGRGVRTRTLEQALEYLRNLAAGDFL